LSCRPEQDERTAVAFAVVPAFLSVIPAGNLLLPFKKHNLNRQIDTQPHPNQRMLKRHRNDPNPAQEEEP
jgi:hypothetical protein